MSSFIGVTCFYCNQVLNETDDIVVCPICGTPHHRECYFAHNRCFNEALHETDFEFIPPEITIKENSLICSHCGKTISDENDFCNYCGTPVIKSTATRSTSGPIFMFGTKLFQGQDTRSDLEENIDGIPIKHWITYIGNNYNYYLNIFKLQDSAKKKTSFTLSAVLYPFLYFLYRRIWGAAIISALTNLVFNFPSIVVMYLAPLGINFGMNIMTLDRLSGVFSIINILINLGWGIFAAWLYRKSAGEKINRIKGQTLSDVDFNDRLKQKSGTSLAAPVIGVIVLTVSLILLWIFLAIFSSSSIL